MKQSKTEILFIVVFVFLSIGLGILFAIPTWDGKIFFHSKVKDRVPSSVEEDEALVEDIPSTIQSYTWNEESSASLIEKARLEYDARGVYLTFGLFLVSNEEGIKENVCVIYKNVELVFYSASMAIHGSPSVMKVIGLCEIAEDHSDEMRSFFIPLREIFTSSPQVGDVKLAESPSLQFFFDNIGFHWPKDWYLRSVRFYRDVNKDESEGQYQNVGRNGGSGDVDRNENVNAENGGNNFQRESLLAENKKQGNELLEEEKMEGEVQLMVTEEEESQSLNQGSFPSEVFVSQEDILKIRGESLLIEVDPREEDS